MGRQLKTHSWFNAAAIKPLIPGSDYAKVLEYLQQTNAGRAHYAQVDTTVFEQCIEEYECEQQRGRLEQAVTPATTSNVRKI